MTIPDINIAALMTSLGVNAQSAAATLALTSVQHRDAALLSSAKFIRANSDEILAANRMDVKQAEQRSLGAAKLDRLMLDRERVAAMASGLQAIANLDDPIGTIIDEWQRPNGLTIQRMSVPLGVIGIIYESRPNVTADAAGLCLKAGNAVILRGGSESFHSNAANHECIVACLEESGMTADSVQMVPTRDRDAVGFLLSSMAEYVDVLVPRGGKRLIKRVQEEARMPVIGHLEGICHVYLHASADATIAREVALNAKMRRTGICGAAESILVDRSVAAELLPDVCAALTAAACEIRGDTAVCAIVAAAIPANDDDWGTEYLDSIVSIRVVDDIDAAIAHIQRFGSAHTESIIADDRIAAERFLREVDSAIVLHNASTQFADGGEFGMGAEIGIATGRIHARGPVGAKQLTSYKYIVRGSGQIRP